MKLDTMKQKQIVSIVFATLVVLSMFFGYTKIMEKQSQQPPEITLWYGDEQIFNRLGQPQKQIDILGNVSDRDGVAALNYTLNDGVETYLSVGPDTRRLVNPGDFNIEIFSDQLNEGDNSVLITAMDNEGNISRKAVEVENAVGGKWQLPYSIDWLQVESIEEVAQVVDGLWEIQEAGVHTVEVGYDRLIAIGDMQWKDYEVVVPVTIHGLSPSGWKHPSGGPAVGILVYWSGHTDHPRAGWQPKSGWLPLGAIGWYRWVNDSGAEQLQLFGNRNEALVKDVSGKKLEFNETYLFKMFVESSNRERPVYKLKVWQEKETEPEDWDLIAEGFPDDPEGGSVVLLAHEAEVTFGKIEITPALE